jgi:dTDP-4-amino-4,6-dideoxygalactose transaminase
MSKVHVIYMALLHCNSCSTKPMLFIWQKSMLFIWRDSSNGFGILVNGRKSPCYSYGAIVL